MRGSRKRGGAASDSQANLLLVGFPSYRPSGHARKSGDSHTDTKEKQPDLKDKRYQDDRDHEDHWVHTPSLPETLPAIARVAEMSKNLLKYNFGPIANPGDLENQVSV